MRERMSVRGYGDWLEWRYGPWGLLCGSRMTFGGMRRGEGGRGVGGREGMSSASAGSKGWLWGWYDEVVMTASFGGGEGGSGGRLEVGEVGVAIDIASGTTCVCGCC